MSDMSLVEKQVTAKTACEIVNKIMPKLVSGQILEFKEWHEFYLAYDTLVWMRD